MNNLKYVKHIGKGSFSDVKLYKYNQPILTDSQVCDFIVIKEIDIGKLAKKYVGKPSQKTTLIHTLKINFTPHHTMDDRLSDYNYYYNKMKLLVKSEIDLLKELNHVHIIRFYGEHEIDDIIYIKTEYCNGGNLQDVLRNKELYSQNRNTYGGFDHSILGLFLKHMSEALLYLYDLNIIHRDIKLQNILVHTSPFSFVLGDFGFACVDQTYLVPSKCDLSIPLEIQMKEKYYKLCGTPYYMAPELIYFIEQSVISNPKYDKKVDVWSLGICLFELIFSSVPYASIKTIKELNAYFLNSNNDHIIESHISKSNINSFYKSLLPECLQKDPISRIDIQTLSSILVNDPLPPVDSIPTPDVSSTSVSISSIPTRPFLPEEEWELVNSLEHDFSNDIKTFDKRFLEFLRSNI